MDNEHGELALVRTPPPTPPPRTPALIPRPPGGILSLSAPLFPSTPRPRML